MFSYTQFIKILLVKISCRPHLSTFFPITTIYGIICILYTQLVLFNSSFLDNISW